jgi:hypothetical protein
MEQDGNDGAKRTPQAKQPDSSFERDKVVDLAGVREMQVSGLHEVCLSTLDPTREICYLTASDTKTVLFSPPIYVRLLTISTP